MKKKQHIIDSEVNSLLKAEQTMPAAAHLKYKLKTGKHYPLDQRAKQNRYVTLSEWWYVKQSKKNPT